MKSIILAATTEKQDIDDILLGTIGLLETVFPNRIKAYYLHGSFVNKSGIQTSDIDLFLIVKSKLTAEEQEKLQDSMSFCARISPVMVEMLALDEATVLQQGHYRVKAASIFLWGSDIREYIPDQSLELYTQMYAHFPWLYMTRMLRGSGNVATPLTYPQKDGLFYGYDQELLPPKNDKRWNIKKLVTSVCWTATILIAWDAGKMVPGKRESIQMYEDYVGGKWASFVREMYEWGNRRWHYLVPDDEREQQKLRILCKETLLFENYYVEKYEKYKMEKLKY